MSEKICDVCGELAVEIQTVRIYDDRSEFLIRGHIVCTDKIHEKIKLVKDLHKKEVDKILKEIGF